MSWDGVRRHWPLLMLLAVGIALRVLVQVTYEPAILFFDSYSYLENAIDPATGSNRPLGYPLVFLRPLLLVGGLALIPLAQHLVGMAMAMAIYACLTRYGVRRWLSALATAPVLLDGYQLQAEQMIMSDVLFQALLVAGLVVLVWHRRPSVTASAAAGLLVGVAATVRSLAAPLLLVAVAYILVTRRGWRPRLAGAAGLVAAGALPLLVYSAWVYQHTGTFQPGTSEQSAQAPYVRTAPLADCGELAAGPAPGYLVDMCPSAPTGKRSQDPGDYQFPWRHGPAYTADYPPGVDPSAARKQFAVQVTLNQPIDVIGAGLHDFLRGFAWKRTTQPGEFALDKWRFHTDTWAYKGDHVPKRAIKLYGGPEPSVDEKPAAFLRSYQSVLYTRGPVFAAGILLPLLAVAYRHRTDPRGLWAPALLVAGTCATVLLAAAAFAFSWRYQLPSIPLLPWAAALGLAALFPTLRETRTNQRATHTRHGLSSPRHDRRDHC